jgi:DUF3102 family protein
MPNQVKLLTSQTPTVQPIDGRANLVALATTIRTAHAGVTLAATNLIEHAFTAGDALIAAKAAVEHGCWLPWLREECDLGEDRAERYMRIARGRAVLEADSARVRNLSLAGALRLLPLSKSTNRSTGSPRPGPRSPQLGSPSRSQKLTRHDVLGWLTTAAIEKRQRLFDGAGLHVVTESIPPQWNLRLAPAGESIADLHRQIAALQAGVHQRDATIGRLRCQLGLHPDDAAGIPDDVAVVSDDGLDIPARLRRAVPA